MIDLTEEKIKVLTADSINSQADTIILNSAIVADSVVSLSPQTNEKTGGKKPSNDTLKKSAKSDFTPDTITKITIKQKVIKKQLVVVKPQQVKDTTVIK